MKFFKTYISAFIILAGLTAGCNKDEFLNEKPRSALVVPRTADDFLAILDYYYLNRTGALGEVSSDNYYLPETAWQALNTVDKNAYIWAKDIYEGTVKDIDDWNYLFQEIYAANVVLEGISEQIENGSDPAGFARVKGWALFMRAYAYFNLSQHFCLAYDEASYDHDPGLPIRLTADVNVIAQRATLNETYRQIISDFQESEKLITDLRPGAYLNRPCKAAVYAALSRVYLSMRKYEAAGACADSSLSLYSSLIDYNTISKTSTIPFSRSAAEVLYQSYIPSDASSITTYSSSALIDTLLYRSYLAGDLRKAVFFRSKTGGYAMKGGYNGTVFNFSGLATDEMYLNRAECYARAGKVDEALNDLNTLLMKRFDRTVTYVPVSASGQAEALEKVLAERRKELIWRGLRWTDIRRLNKEGYHITLTRRIGTASYTLEPDSKRYALPVPLQEIQSSGLIQNER